MRRRLLVLALCFFAVIPATAAITGTIMTTTGQPVAGARIDVFALEPAAAVRARLLTDKPEATPLASAQSDAKGRFTIESPKDAVVTMRVLAPGYAPVIERIERDEDAGAIALTAAETKTGTITADGKPVAGANVVFNNGELIATTDAQGRYNAPDPSKWGGGMTILHPDYAIDDFGPMRLMGGFGGRGRRAGAAAQTAGNTASLNESLTAGTPLTGTVVGEDGKTAAGGTTILIGGWPVATSAQDGTFTIRHAPPAWQTITATAGNLVGVRSRAANANVANVVIKLAKASSVTGSIRDSRTKVPLSGAEVRIFQPMRLGGATSESWSAVTDAKGNFAVAGIAPGSYQMTITRPGYDSTMVNIALKAGESMNKPLVAKPLARVSGTVVDESKRPVVAARIASANVSGGGFPTPFTMMGGRGSAFSAPDGSFSLRAEPDIDVEIVANRTGFPQAKTATLHLAPGERKSGIVLTVPNGVPVTGRVADKDGKPLAGVEVASAESEASGGGNAIRRMVNTVTRARNSDEQVKTAADGTFTIRIKEGTYDLVFARSGYASKLVRALRVTASTQPVQVTMEPAVEISGRVTRGGSGVDGVRVTAIGESAMESAETGPDGSFVIGDLAPGQVMVNAMKPDEFIQIMRPVTAPATGVNLEAPPGSRVSGRVVDKDTKQPIAAFDLGVGMSRGGGGMMFNFVPAMRHFTSDDGSFVLENVPAGQTQIVVNAPGYTTARVPNVSIEEGKGVADLEVDMDHGVRVVGHVTGPDGSPLAGASVRVAASGGMRTIGPMGQNNQTVTDANGDYSIDAVESGDKSILFAFGGLQATTKSATLSGTETRVDAQLTNGTPVYGTVVTDAGAPVADASVNASSAAQSAGGFQSTRTDANGSFSFSGLAPGHYAFRASKAGYSSDSVTDFDITTGAPVRLTLKSGAVIFGRITGLTADELQNATVQATSANGGGSAPVDSSGNYRMEGAPSGTVRVSARVMSGFAGGKTSPVQSVQVDPSAPAEVDIAFKADTIITGHVTRNGSPVDGAVVAFNPQHSEAQTTARTTTSNGGQYQVSGLDDATYTVSVVDIQRSAPYSTSYPVHGSGNFDIDMKAASLRGHVVDTNGSPVSGAIVEVHEKADGSGMPLMNRSVQSDQSGMFSVANVQAGSYTLTAAADGYGTKSVDTTVGDSDAQVDIALSQNAGVALHVVDARNGQALNARVHVTDMNGATIYDTPFMGGSGGDTIKLPLDAGSYRAQIAAMNYAPQTVTITSPSSPTIGLTPGGTIAVQSQGNALRRARLIGADGNPYAGHSYFTVDPTPGVTLLRNIAAGMYTLQILDNNNQVTASAPVTVADGQTVSVSL